MSKEDNNIKRIPIRSIIEHSKDIFFIHDQEDILRYISPQIIQILGYTPDELIGKKWHKLFAQEYSLQIRKEAIRQLDENKEYHIETEVITKNGKKKQIKVEGSRFYEGKEKLGLIGTVRDITEKTKLDNEIQKQKEELEMFIQTSGLPFCTYDKEGNILQLNESAAKYMNGEVKDFLNKNIFDLWPKQDAEEYLRRIQKCFNEEKEFDTLDNISLPKSNKWMLSTYKPIKNSYGNIYAVQIVSADVTERKEIEKKLKESEEKYRSIYKNIPIPYQSLNEKGKIQEINKTWLDTLGYKREEVIGKNFSEFLVGPLADTFTSNFSRFKTQGHVSNIPFKLKKKNGEIIHVIFFGNIEYDKNKEFLRTHCVFQNITEKKKIEELLTDHTSKLESAQKIGKMGAWNHNIVNDVLEWTDENYRIFGLKPGTTINSDIFLELVHPDDRDYVFKKWNEGIKEKEYDIEHRIRSQGQIRWVRQKAKIHHDDKGKAISAEGITQDITEVKKAEQELKKSEERLLEVLDSTPFPVAIADLQNENISYWSNSAIEILGHAPSSVKEWYEQAYPDKTYREEVIKRWKPFVKEAQKTKKVVNAGEYEVTCKNGDVLTCEIHVNIVEENMIVTLNNITERKKAEEVVRKEKEFTEKTINALPGVFYIISKENKFIKWNKNFTEVAGLSDEEMKVISPLDLFEGEDKKKIAKAIEEAFTKGDTLVESSFVTKKGNKIPYYFNGSKITLDGETYLVGMGIDITEKRKNENALIQSEEKYRTLFNNMLNGFAYHKMLFNEKGEPSDYVFLEVNKAFEELTGLKGELAKGKKVTEVMPGIEKDAAGWIPRYGEIALTGKAAKFENYSDQINKWFSIIAFSPQKNHFATIFEDITEKKLVEDKLLQSRDKLLKIINNTSQLIVAVDKNGIITEWNRTIEEKTHLKEKEVIGKHISEINGSLSKLSQEILASLETGKSSMNEYDIEDSQKNIFSIVSNTSVLRTTNFEIDGVILVGRDVSYRRNIQKEIQEGKAYITNKPLKEITKIFMHAKERYDEAICVCRSSNNNQCICEDIKEKENTQSKEVQEVLLGEQEGEQYTKAKEVLDKIQEKTKKNTIILLTRLDYLVHQLGFSETLKILYTLNDHIKQNKHSSLIIHIAKDCFNEQEMSILKQEFDMFNINKQNENQLAEKYVNILKFIDNRTINHLTVNYNTIAKEFDVSRVTVRAWLDELQEKHLLYIQKEGKEKTVQLTSEGKEFLA